MSSIGFYNLENLFDTLDTEGTNDFEFTPKGEMRYNTRVYTEKLQNLSSVIAQLAPDAPDGVAVLGVSEIENRAVLEDLVKHPNLANRKYNIVHFEGPDKRGVDIGLLYQPKYFEVLSARPLPVSGVLENGDSLFTRDILLVSGLFLGEPMHFMVGHWPSRRGGEKASEPLRKRAAGVCRRAADSIFQKEPNAKIAIMGDLNDDPTNESILHIVGAKGDTKKVEAKGFFNPFFKLFQKGIGSHAFNDAWGLFDQILISHAFLDKGQKGMSFHKAEVFNKPFLTSKTGRFKGYPFRTYSFGEYIGGYSDHYPTFIYVRKPAGK